MITLIELYSFFFFSPSFDNLDQVSKLAVCEKGDTNNCVLLTLTIVFYFCERVFLQSN